jgi:hypothetical protein
VVMFNFTPAVFRRLYDLYPGRAKARFDAGRELDVLRAYAARAGRELDFSRGIFSQNNLPGTQYFKVSCPRII